MLELVKILMLEDNEVDAEMIQHQLSKDKLPYLFQVAENKESFLDALSGFGPDIILSDHSLPGFNSMDALATARGLQPHIPFIIVTGTVSEEFAAGIIKLGADDYILKDRLARLSNAIITTIQLRRSELEKQEALAAKQAMEREIICRQILEQQKIARTIMDTQEKERNRLGQELHDNINQILVTVKMYLATAVAKNGEIQHLVQFPLDLVDKTIEEIRTLSSRLATPSKNIRLKDVVQSLADELARQQGIDVQLEYELPDKLISDELKLNIFRIVQEQFTNIAKHAAASQIQVYLLEVPDHIVILVADNGKGFNVNNSRTGIGLSNIMNRVEAFNGSVEILTGPGQGCEIRCKIPLPKRHSF
jgi:signal transduction histidine kinase